LALAVGLAVGLAPELVLVLGLGPEPGDGRAAARVRRS
jgi:hypothetical protein